MTLPPNLTAPSAQPLPNIPQNLAGTLPLQTQTALMKWMYDTYIFPQVLERMQYERIWDDLLEMYRIKIKSEDIRWNTDDAKKQERMEEVAVRQRDPDKAQVSDTLLFDAVDRLKNLNHFISWKEGMPVQYNIPPHFSSAKEGAYYHPLADKIKSANCLLQWNIDQQDVYRNHLILAGHHYLYGCCFVSSEFEYQVKSTMKRTEQGIMQVPEVHKIGITFEPISIRKLWLNYRLPVYKMEQQPCPFMFEEMPRFEVMSNPYDPINNPFGYLNLDRLQNPQWLFQQMEMDSFRKAVYSRLPGNAGTELIRPEFSAEGRWTFYPMLPLDPNTMEFEKRADGTPIPLTRYIVQWFGTNLRNGEMYPIRIQPWFYPMGRLPLYASQHMPDMDSGAYSLSIGEVLRSYYEQVCTAKNQWLDNKNLQNNPPSWHVVGSPCENQDVNQPGAKVRVLGPNDFGWRQVPDATQTTVQFLEYLRQQAQTTSKATEAILGQAMGGRTSATEAQNVFQSAMSGVTTDINLFNQDIMGGYALRVWELCGLWFDLNLIKMITGQFGSPLTLEDLNSRVGIKWDIGATYIESIIKQQHLQYAIQSAATSPALRQDILWREYFAEIKSPSLQAAVIDNGFSEQVAEATEQAVETYLGMPVNIDPTQDHQVALEVKSRFIKDTESNWNKQYGGLPSPMQGMTRVQWLVQQTMIHQQFVQIQLQQQLAMMQVQGQAQIEQEQQKQLGNRSQKQTPSRMDSTAGQYAQ